MNKFLLFSCAFAACVSASAQRLQKAPVANAPVKLSSLSATQFKGFAAKAKAQKVSTDQFVGTFINNSFDEQSEINTATIDNMYKANVTDDNGNVLNLKWEIYQNAIGHIYASLDENTNTFVAPAFQYVGDGASIEIGDGESSPIIFAGVSTNDYFCDFTCKYDPATGSLTPNDTIQGYYMIVAEGTYANQWILRNISPTIARANATHTGYYNTQDGWTEFEQPVWLDLSAAEDGVIDVYNHFLQEGSTGCKLSIDVDGDEASMATGQPMLYISNEADHATYGKYILLRGVEVDEAAGTVRPDFDMATIEGGSYSKDEIFFDNIYYRGFSQVVNGQGYATPFYVNSRFQLASTGIAGVTVKADKAADNRIYNLAGQQVGKDYKGVVIQNGVKKLQK